MESIVRIFLATGESKAVRCDDETTVERVLQVVLKGIGIGEVAHPHFALRVLAGPTMVSPLEAIWLHPNLLIRHVRSLYHQIPQSSTSGELRFELRLRFVPQSSYELLLTESKAFFYLHEQVFADFQKQIAWKIPLETALELAALRVSREYVEKQARNCIEPKIDLDAIDAEAAINTFVPETVLIKANVKAKELKRQFLSSVKRFASLSTTDSVLRSLSILLEIVRFDVEIFKTSIGAGWTSPVDLLVGPEVSLSYRINERCDISRLGELRCVLEISVRKMEPQCEKAIVQLRLSGSAQPLLITTPSLSIAESLAHLIDGYQMMYNQGPSVYKMKGLERCESLDLKTPKTTGKSMRTDATDPDLRIKREHVTLKELIGGGQFGNVYKGIYNPPGESPQAVAIKVCKLENEPADTQLILQESHLMRRFCHENIVSLIGVCAESPMWLVIELAPYGELRQYLIGHKGSLEVQTLLLFCSQVSSALEYLHSLQFVHRDVAARNVLVCSPNLVKLTDFGLSRALDHDAVYTASRGKLPIKWMAPESINFREFSMASDVWMFGVCCWEILSWGQKPWVGVANADVIGEIEAGHRPACPETCALAFFNYLEQHIWAFQPPKRPLISEVSQILRDVIEQLKRRVHPDQIRIVRPIQNIPVIRTNIESLPNLTLWRTLEDQRRQMEEDERWLREQEEIEPMNKSMNRKVENHSLDDDPDENLNQMLNSLILDEIGGNNGNTITKTRKTTADHHASTKSLPNGVPNLSAISCVRKAAESIVECVAKLTNTYNQNVKHEDFVQAIKEITLKLREMFSESSTMVTDCSEEKQHEIEKCEALIGNDMRQMSRAMQSLAEPNTPPVAYNAHRRDVVRIGHDLATNCQCFVSLLEQRHRKSPPNFSSILTDC